MYIYMRAPLTWRQPCRRGGLTSTERDSRMWSHTSLSEFRTTDSKYWNWTGTHPPPPTLLFPLAHCPAHLLSLKTDPFQGMRGNFGQGFFCSASPTFSQIFSNERKSLKILTRTYFDKRKTKKMLIYKLIYIHRSIFIELYQKFDRNLKTIVCTILLPFPVPSLYETWIYAEHEREGSRAEINLRFADSSKKWREARTGENLISCRSRDKKATSRPGQNFVMIHTRP